MANELVLDALSLDLGDYAPPEGLITYFRNDATGSAAGPSRRTKLSDAKEPAEPNTADSFLSFLATAQAREVDFLPVMWDESMRGVGTGGQASISQSHVSDKLSYVYKRIRREDLKTAASETRAMQALAAEVTVLGHSGLRGHPNIVRLTGICWDIPPAGGDIWPVLVFEKAPNRDLRQFMESDAGRKLDVKQRLKLCQDIAAAVTLMHSINVIHGDIKPQNVLIFNNVKGNFVAKVTDFGFATLEVAASKDGRIELPISDPWNAPEISLDEDYSLREAKLTDVYSFGLLCLWLLFTDSPQLVRHLSIAKSEGQLLAFAHARVQSLASLDPNGKRSLCDFFDSTIAHDPKGRALDLQQSMQEFAAFITAVRNDGFSMYEMYMPYLKVLPHHRDFNVSKAQDEHYEQPQLSWSDLYSTYSSAYGFTLQKASIFQLPKSFRQLIHCDYRLWNYIFRLFKGLSEEFSPVSDGIRQSAVYQLAFCHYTGFGTSLDENVAQNLLNTCGRSMQDLRNDVDSIETDLNPMRYKNLETEIVLAAYQHHYHKLGILSDAQAVYQAVCTSLDIRLGETHSSSIALREALGMIQIADGKYGDACQTLEEVVQRSEQAFGPKHAVTISSITSQILAAKLAKFYDKESKLKVKLLDAKRKRPKPQENRSNIAALLELADGFEVQCRVWEEREAKRQVEEIRVAQVEEAMPDDKMKDLGTRILELSEKKFQGACQLGEKIFETVPHCLDKEDPAYLAALDLAHTLFSYEPNWKRCEETKRQSLELRQSILGAEHPDTLRDMADLAKSIIDQTDSRYWQGLNLLADALELQVRVLGYANGLTVRTMDDLAVELHIRVRDEETAELKEAGRARANDLDPEYGELQPDPGLSMAYYGFTPKQPKPRGSAPSSSRCIDSKGATTLSQNRIAFHWDWLQASE